MSTTMFDSNTFGVGELITQRKLFNVPLHQRSYSWGVEEVEQFLIDITMALKGKSTDYFIGLMVLQGPSSGVWQILDGQQRLTTVTMIYSAIRNWLKERGFNEDADQIETEYLGVRQLGGAFSSRLKLNSLNNDLFEKFVIRSSPTIELERELSSHAKGASNHNLLTASIECRKWIAKLTQEVEGNAESQARALFQLSTFLESGVKVVTVDVATNADPYILFEALNNRGADLTALDLVKNYIFSVTEHQDYSHIEGLWAYLIDLIDSTDADDFLKYFWTGRFGIIQKTDLFKKIRSTFKGKNAGENLLLELIDAAEIAQALQEEEHPLWMNYSKETNQKILGIRAIGSKQARPLLYSAIKRLDEERLENFVDTLITCLVRFQVIGHGRTGVLEKVLGRLCTLIWESEGHYDLEYKNILRELLTSDEQFLADFNVHHEKKISRAHYILNEIEVVISNIRSTNSKAVYLQPIDQIDNEEPYKKIGSYFLLEYPLVNQFSQLIKEKSPTDFIAPALDLLRASSHPSTHFVNQISTWTSEEAERRTRELALLASRRWPITGF